MAPTSFKNQAVSEADEIDLGRLFGEFIDHRKLIVSVTAFFTVMALLYSLFSTPIYQADALVQVEQKQGNALLDSINQVLPNGSQQSAPEIALLQSRMILGKTVDDLNLETSISRDYFPIFGNGWARLTGENAGEVKISKFLLNNEEGNTESKLTVIDNDNFIISTDSADYKGKVGIVVSNKDLTIMVDHINAPPGASFTISKITRLQAINNLQKVLSVADQGKDTGMLNLTLTGEEPKRVTAILDSISQNYLAQNISRQAAQDEKSLDFLKAQLPKVRDELDNAEDKLNSYRKTKDSVDLTMEAQAVLNQIVNVDNQLNELTFREAEISQLFTPDHPTYKALLEKKKTLAQERLRLNNQVTAMPATQQEILRLSRDVESGRAVYMQLLNRQQELNISKSSTIGNVRIVDSAIAEPKPVKPKKIMVVLIGLVFGIFVSAGIVFGRMFLRRGIESPEVLEELGINVYASVPVSEWLTQKQSKTGKVITKKALLKQKEETQSLLALDNPADLAIEAIRSLRTSLHFAMMESSNNVLMISGASPNAGKSFISSNLAVIIAQTGKKVLLIDADMRKGYIHRVFGKNNDNGLSDILSGKVEFEKAVKNSQLENLNFVCRGQVPPNPSELLMHPRFKAFLDQASSNYDLILIDTPPILAVTDAAIIGQYVGTALLVARFELNTAKEIEISKRRFEQSGVPVKGCILNGVIKKASSYYGYGYNHYGYTYNSEK
ncbi:polysaccharide biosynthesis tyrosine autokinase [Raoultella terrigena]|uniref:Tyrosine-protein kinase n=2 Tax=Klebsiella TaxID=570 RepID=A0A0P0YSZ1_9ENTR|nr:polysaccharide biosynthesis tyrosine autokinase [Raoultella terrigena]BAT24283.1 tyrosine-protein kinase [Klebsiella sp. 889]VUC77830.1 tyrosine-protein kinase Etk [Raoultella terrigena]